MILDHNEAKQILDKVFGLSKADAASASLSGEESTNIRFARNEVTTSGTKNNLTLSVTTVFGKRVGTTSTNQFDDESLRTAVRKAEEIAKVSPENPEYMPPLEPSAVGGYEDIPGWDDATATISPEYRAEAAETSIRTCEKENLIAAGFLDHSAGFSAFVNSKGLFAYRKATDVDYSLTARTEDGQGSGWAARHYNAARRLNVEEVAATAAHRGKTTANARVLEPGKYTTILDPCCVADLIQDLVFSLDARDADEGRSWVAEKGGGNKLGHKVFPESITIYSDPANLEVPGSPWEEDGVPQKKTTFIEKGILKNLIYSRYWASKQGKEPLPFPSNIIMEGGSATIEEMIASIDRGILLSSLWYIRSVDPQTLLLTGLTRDGTYFIENGKIAYPIKNFRWNESPVAVLKNVEMLGQSVRMPARDADPFPALIPPLKVREFTFSSLSDAV